MKKKADRMLPQSLCEVLAYSWKFLAHTSSDFLFSIVLTLVTLKPASEAFLNCTTRIYMLPVMALVESTGLRPIEHVLYLRSCHLAPHKLPSVTSCTRCLKKYLCASAVSLDCDACVLL